MRKNPSTQKSNRYSDWETAHENLLAELLSSDSGDAKDNPQENTDAETEGHQEVV